LNESGKTGPKEYHDPRVDPWTAEFLRSLSESSSDMILSVNSEDRVDYANTPALKKFGYSENELISLSLTDLAPARSRDLILSNLHKLRASEVGGKILRSAWDVGRRKDGSEFPIEASLSLWNVGSETRVLAWVKDITGGQELESTLRILGKAVDQSPVIVIVTDPDGKIEYVNSKFREVTGYASSEVVGKTPRILKSGELPDSFYQRMWSTLKAGNDWRGEFHNRTKAGGYYWAWATISPVKDPHGAITHMVAIQEDVTERKAQELELADVNKTLGALVDATPLAVVILDNAAAVRLWNPAAEKLFGWTREEVIGHFNPLVLPDRVDGFREMFSSLLATGMAPVREVTCMKKDGSIIQASLDAAPMLDPAGVVSGAVLLLTDITERKLLEEVLRASEERFRHAFDDAPMGMTITRKDGTYFRVNRALSEMVGYSVEELQSMGFESITHPEDLPRNLELRSRLAEGKEETFSMEKRYIHKDGHIVWTQLNVSALHDAAGRRAFDLSVVQDISERKRLEAQIMQYSAGLEKMVKRRTRQLAESQTKLLQAERMATIGSLAAQVGHDLRNPLTTVNTGLYFLFNVLQEDKDRRVGATLLQMDNAVRHANKIIEDLLMYSRQSSIKKIRLDLNEPVRAAVETVAIPSSVKVSTELCKAAKVAGDRSRLVRVFQNLITNAVDAMPSGGKLRIASSASRGWASVSVSDTGVGMSPAQMRRIFLPLYTTKARGLGMGLPICKRLVEAHGGHISAASRLGRGSTFTVSIPLAPTRGKRAHIPRAPSRSRAKV